MKTKTRKYKTKHRKTRRGGQIIPSKVAPEPPTTAPVEVKKNAPVEPPKSSWFSFFGPVSKPGDKIIEAAEKLITLASPKLGDVKNKTIQTVIDDSKKLA
jgi:hypothetical protein